MSLPELVERMSRWLAGDYTAILLEEQGAIVAYALYCEKPDEVHLRQLFVVRDRRRQGIGRKSIEACAIRDLAQDEIARRSTCSLTTNRHSRSVVGRLPRLFAHARNLARRGNAFGSLIST